MKRISSKVVMLATATMVFAFTASMYKSYADEKIYQDSDVSISAAVERYIAANGNASDITTGNDENTQGVGDETEAATEAAETEATTADESETVYAEQAGNKIKYPDYQGKAIVCTSGNVNIRKDAGTEYDKVGIIPSGGIMNVMAKGDEWSLVASGNVVGYISNEYILFDDEAGEYANTKLDKVALVTGNTLRVRKEASTDSDIVTLIPIGEKYAIIENGPEWTKIEIDQSLSGYVSNEFISIVPASIYATPIVTTSNTGSNNNNSNSSSSNSNNSNNSSANSNSNNSSQQQTSNTTQAATEAPAQTTEAPASSSPSEAGVNVANYALQFVGNPYVYGGTSLTNGADCSGFTLSVYAKFGISLPHSATAQSKYGTEVSLSALQPGDLVFYDHSTGSIEHVGIYIGNGQVVHASSSRTGIIVSRLNYSPPYKAVRLVQ